jgi:hypothetical protein
VARLRRLKKAVVTAPVTGARAEQVAPVAVRVVLAALAAVQVASVVRAVVAARHSQRSH